MHFQSWLTTLLSQLSEQGMGTQAKAESLRQLAGCPQLKTPSKPGVCKFGVQSYSRAFHTGWHLREAEDPERIPGEQMDIAKRAKEAVSHFKCKLGEDLKCFH